METAGLTLLLGRPTIGGMCYVSPFFFQFLTSVLQFSKRPNSVCQIYTYIKGFS